MHNRIGGGFSPPPSTPPGMRVRTRRFPKSDGEPRGDVVILSFCIVYHIVFWRKIGTLPCFPGKMGKCPYLILVPFRRSGPFLITGIGVLRPAGGVS